MSAATQQILDSFDALSDAEKHPVGIEVLRRIATVDESDFTGQALVVAADELFRTLDEEEDNNAPR
jgi:hypothetical protein